MHTRAARTVPLIGLFGLATAFAGVGCGSEGSDPAVCGDGVCSDSETPQSCPEDCAESPECGNDLCEEGETSKNCPEDCPAAPTCGDDVCDADESDVSCPVDCTDTSTCELDDDHWTCRYRTLDGVDPNLTSVDVYVASVEDAPLMVYVHGGGWGRGDKAAVHAKATYFASHGFVFASVNYRLSPHIDPLDPPEELDPDRLIYPKHEVDVAAAVGFLKAHAEFFGANPDRISLIGHSAGAGIVALLGTDESFLAASGVSLADDVQCAIPLDIGGAYDLDWLADTEEPQWFWWNAFGPLEAPPDAAAREAYRESWRQASPLRQIDEGEDLPSFFIVTNDSELTRGGAQSQELRDALQETAAPAVELLVLGSWVDDTWVESLSHRELNLIIGDPNDDQYIMPTLEPFLLAHCGGSPAATANPFPELSLELDHSGPGTEVNTIVAHEGALFATVSTWNASDPQVAVQVLRKEGPGAPWVVDFEFPKQPEMAHIRAAFMSEVTFLTDAGGTARPSPHPAGRGFGPAEREPGGLSVERHGVGATRPGRLGAHHRSGRHLPPLRWPLQCRRALGRRLLRPGARAEPDLHRHGQRANLPWRL